MSLLLNDYQIGAHKSFSGKIYDTVYDSINSGMYVTQFFMGNPYGFDRAKITTEDIQNTKRLIKSYPIDIFTHYPYVANLAGSKETLAWNGDEKQDNKTGYILKSLEYELSVLSNFPNNGVVIHPGNFKDRNRGLITISQSINKINFTENSKLVLENSAGQGTSLATTFQEIKTIIDNVDEYKRQNIGVCIDTCHTFAYGLYDLSITSQVEKMFNDFNAIIGLDKLSLVHLNDSKEKYGSKKDRHELLKHGYIWKHDDSSLKYLIQKCKQLNIPCILETQESDMITVVSLI
jgi:deoxyribonuclease-4